MRKTINVSSTFLLISIVLLINIETIAARKVLIIQQETPFDSVSGNPVKIVPNPSGWGWDFTNTNKVKAQYLYFYGGINNPDVGRIGGWGTNKPMEILTIGEQSGSISIIYEDETIDVIPIIYGYTLWYNNDWKLFKEPFTLDHVKKKELESILCLKDAFEAKPPYTLRIALRNKGVKKVIYSDNVDKVGKEKFSGLRFENVAEGLAEANYVSSDFSVSDSAGFFLNHTISSSNPYPLAIQGILKLISDIFWTSQDDINAVKTYSNPINYKGPDVIFTNTAYANIMTSIFRYNLTDQVSRIDSTGVFHESASGAPNCGYYSGFGTWKFDGTYHRSQYSRNGGLNVLAETNYLTEVERAVNYLNKQLMFFPNGFPELQLGGMKIPGHWTVVVNNPFEYVESVKNAPGAWKTQYTYENFGEHYDDYGNPEPDGHGMSMIQIWNYWNRMGKSSAWAKNNWTYINEAAYWIKWGFDYPKLSFNSNGLIYGETEPAMCTATMYSNLPCYLGLLMYAEMADSLGEKTKAEEWRLIASNLKTAMENKFAAVDEVYGKIWTFERQGDSNMPNPSMGYDANIDIVAAFFCDYLGKDVKDLLPAGWYERTYNTYRKNRDDNNINNSYTLTAGALGYSYGAIAQTALLLDQMVDATAYMKTIAGICYNPRLPSAFIVPEMANADPINRRYMKLGDIGNLAQQSGILKTILISIGIDDLNADALKIMPRLPYLWNLKLTDYAVRNFDEHNKLFTRKLSIDVKYPQNKSQLLKIKSTNGNLRNVSFRAGPFPLNTITIMVTTNRKNEKFENIVTCFNSGDSAWAWLNLGELSDNDELKIKISYK